MKALLAAIITLALFSPASAQIEDTTPGTGLERLIEHIKTRNQSLDLQAAGVKAFEAGDLVEAERLFTEQAALDPTNFTAHYNLACMRALAGDADSSWAHLTDALQNGFIDAFELRRDPSLASMRDDARMVALLENFGRMIEAHRTASVGAAQRWIGTRAERRTLDELRVEVFSNHDEVATDDAVDELELVAAFARTLMPDLGKGAQAEYDPWIVVTLPDQQRFMNWSIQIFGPAARDSFSQIGGAYDHDARRLVARDLGATLRHEFFHVLLWRDMSHRGVAAPIWIQEGLASLVEDGHAGGGRFIPTSSWRTNIAKRLEKNAKLPKIEELTSLTHERFSTSRPLRQYALARTFFLFVYDRGVLPQWYAEYTANATTDPDGLRALEAVLGMNADEMHDAYRAWVRDLPMIAESADDLDVRLGVEVSNGDGDGPVVVGFADTAARRETGLRLRDVITSVNSQPTRDLQELIRLLGDMRPGQTITVNFRRGRLHKTTRVTLRDRKED